MKRFWIFTGLFPTLVLLVFIAIDSASRHTIASTWGWLLVLSYTFSTIPGWVTAAVDVKLSGKPAYQRIPLTALTGAAAVMTALVVVHFGEILSTHAGFLIVAFMGAIPAAVCSWLSSINGKATRS